MARRLSFTLAVLGAALSSAAACSYDTSADFDLDAPGDGGPGSSGTSGASSGQRGPLASNGVKDGDETDVDCGGSAAPPCAAGQGCLGAGDCVVNNCNLQGVCAEPTADDGLQNGDETDVDCGGASAPGCAPGQGCAAASDCASLVCTAQRCVAPRYDDGVKNGDETDVDCGGVDAPADKRCAVGSACLRHGDCGSDGCGYQQRCVLGRSCTQQHGGDTCGTGELGEAGAQHESCCTALPVTGVPGVLLGKYNITAGRMRAFLERVEENVAGWIGEHRPAYWHDEWTPYLPTGHLTPVAVVGSSSRNLGVVGQLGPNFLFDQPGIFGCFMGPDEARTGGATYYQPVADRQLENPDDVGHKYSQELLDQKPLNCVSFLMLAAFCAWDGGRLATAAELDAAWGPATYPWGDAPIPAGYSSGYPNPEALSPAGGDPLRANYLKNYPTTPATFFRTDYDNASYISPPGRFPLGAGPDGHMDLAGSVFQLALSHGSPVFDFRDPPPGVNWDPASLLVRWSKSGSWEGHAIGSGTYSEALRKYWAAGGRCAYDQP